MKRECDAQFEEDQLRYSWWFGDHPLIKKARERCEALPHLQDVLQNLTLFDWNLRMSYEVKMCAEVDEQDLLKHPVFEPLRTESIGTNGDSVYSIDVEKLRGIVNRQLQITFCVGLFVEMFQTKGLTDEQVLCLERVLEKEYQTMQENQDETDEVNEEWTVERVIVKKQTGSLAQKAQSDNFVQLVLQRIERMEVKKKRNE